MCNIIFIASITQVPALLLTFLMYQVQIEACDKGWFGRKCEFRCRCQNMKCGVTGECERSHCAPGYFGPSCQYVDLAFKWDTEPSHAYLHASFNSSCNSNSSANLITFKLIQSFQFSWMRIQTNDKSKMTQFNIWLDLSPNLCMKWRYFVVSATIIDVTCSVSTKITSVTLLGNIVGALCFVHISGGHNVALKQATSQSSTLRDLTSSLAVDGSTSIGSTSCSKTHQYYREEWWSIHFVHAQVVKRVTILYNATELNQVFVITLLSEDMKVNEIVSKSESLTSDDLVRASTSAGSVKTSAGSVKTSALPVYVFVSKLETFSLRIYGAPNQALSLCEVEIYAETSCLSNMYGLNCAEKCACRSDQICSSITGVCGEGCHGSHNFKCVHACSRDCSKSNCAPGGKNCSTCLTGYTGGGCNNVCPNKTYGNNCTQKCNKYCKGELCHHITGVCYGCVTGHIGPQCEACPPQSYGEGCNSECPAVCDSQLCDNVNGDCFKCLPGFTGHKCNACPNHYYGAECKLNCSKLCFNKLCNNINGNCLKCTEDRLLPLCEACISTTWGADCSLNCSSTCDRSICDSKSGQCAHCNIGYIGSHCTACPLGTYGQECAFSCLNACVNKSCNTVTGSCVACSPGYFGPQCQVCPTRTYGKNCSQKCPTACKKNECDHVSGNCFSCNTGTTGRKCAIALTPQGISMFKTILVFSIFCSIIPICAFVNQKIQKSKMEAKKEETSSTSMTLTSEYTSEVDV